MVFVIKDFKIVECIVPSALLQRVAAKLLINK